MEILLDDPSAPDVAALLDQHLQEMRALSPPESVHALEPHALSGADVIFWSVREGGELLGCGALKHLDATHVEIKSMRTVPAHRRRGVARYLLEFLIDQSRRRGYSRMSLETGSMPAFEPARSLYASAGFEPCEPFADYVEDPHSVFMTRAL